MLALADKQPPIVPTFDDSPYGPPPIGPDEYREMPRPAPLWLEKALGASGLDDAEIAALLERAPLDIRVNRINFQSELLADQLPGAEPIPHVADALRLPSDTPVEKLPAIDLSAPPPPGSRDHLLKLGPEAFAAGLRSRDRLRPPLLRGGCDAPASPLCNLQYLDIKLPHQVIRQRAGTPTARGHPASPEPSPSSG